MSGNLYMSYFNISWFPPYLHFWWWNSETNILMVRPICWWATFFHQKPMPINSVLDDLIFQSPHFETQLAGSWWSVPVSLGSLQHGRCGHGPSSVSARFSPWDPDRQVKDQRPDAEVVAIWLQWIANLGRFHPNLWLVSKFWTPFHADHFKQIDSLLFTTRLAMLSDNSQDPLELLIKSFKIHGFRLRFSLESIHWRWGWRPFPFPFPFHSILSNIICTHYI